MFSATSDMFQSTNTATVSSLLARRSVKRLRDDECETQLQESCVNLLTKHQNTSQLLLEITSCGKIRNISCDRYEELEKNTAIPTSFLEDELQRRLQQMEVSVGLQSVTILNENIHDLIKPTDTDSECVLLSAKQRADVCVLLKSTRALLSVGIFSPELLWEEYWKMQPVLEVMYHLHTHNILTLEYMLERDVAVSSWISEQLKALCFKKITTPEDHQIQHEILSTVVCVLVRRGFEDSDHKLANTCCSILDTMISWLLDSLGDKSTDKSTMGVWVQVYDASTFGVCVSEDTLQQFFTHTLVRVLTHRPVFKVSDAVALQSEWTFAKTPPLLTTLFCKICLVFSVDCVLSQLQQVLETHEVNWRHVLSCLSNLLIYHSQTQRCLTDLLSRLLRAAFDNYDVEKMITSFLLARQASLEGPAVFPSYSDWFKLSFGGSSTYHGNSKKSTVFLLKFLSDLVPFEPPQYLKVHVMHAPCVGGKHRSLLQEYITLAKTRLTDLKVSLEDTGIFEVVNGSAGVVNCPAQQDVEKAITLFTVTNKVPATVIEASIFRRPYFLSRFLPVLLSPRVLPLKADTRMSFIEALRKADKIPAALYTSYTESCQRETERQQKGLCESVEVEEDHQMVLQDQFVYLRRMLTDGAADGDVCAQLSRISLTMRTLCTDEETASDVITLNLQLPDSTNTAVVSLIIQNFCLCLLAASKLNPPNRQGSWASIFLKILLGHRQLFSALIHRLWDLLHNQANTLSLTHVLGLAALLVELHYYRHMCPQMQVMWPSAADLSVSELLSDGLICSTRSHMAFCLRFCVAVLSYGLCRANTQSEELQNFIPEKLYKKALYLIPRLILETRTHTSDECDSDMNTDMSDLTGRMKDATIALWQNKQIKSLQKHYQLSFSEWLSAELHVLRSQDALTDPERQEYEQWACEQFYLPISVSDGGCGGDVTRACAHIITAVLDQHTVSQTAASSSEHTDGCLPDLLSLLQVLLYEVAVTQQNTSDNEGHFLWDLIDSRCSVTPDTESIRYELEYQKTLQNVSRVLVMIPAVLLVRVRTDAAGRKTLDCHRLMKHINDAQRGVCCPADFLSLQLTAHFFKAVVIASVRCDHPADTLNASLSLFCAQCPLLLLSAVRWWTHVSSALSCQWKRLTGRDTLPEQLQILSDCHRWSRRVNWELVLSPPSAPSWLLAACLHSVLERSTCEIENIKLALRRLNETDRRVLLFLFLYSVMKLISAHLESPGAACLTRAREFSVSVFTHLIDDSDWLQLFDGSGSDHRLSDFTSHVMSRQMIRLRPFAFYSILCGVESEVLMRAVRSSGFLYSAAVSYKELNKLFLNGQTGDDSQQQTLLESRQVLMKCISLSSPDSLTLSQKRKLQSEFEQLDSEISASFITFSCDTHFT